jgi:C-terminal peptidase prc
MPGAMRRRIRFIALLVPLLFGALACKAITQAWAPHNPPTLPAVVISPSPTAFVIPTDTSTPAPTSTPLPSPTPLPPTPTPSPIPTVTSQPTASIQQLQVFEELWKTVKDNYLYRDFNGLDWDAVHVEYRQKIEAGLTEEEFYQAMDEMIYRLGDDHSIFLSPQSAAEEDAHQAGDYDYVGIGVLNEVVPERRLVTIILVFPGSPAEKAGLAIHDSILAVDGQPVVDENGFRQDLLRGPEGTKITLTVRTPGQAPRQVEITRRRINSGLPVPHSLLTTPGGKRVGYLLLASFEDSTIGNQVRKALQELTKDGPLDGVILDNRENGGGVNTAFSDTLGFFTKGLLGYFVNRQEQDPLRILGEDIKGSQSVPLVVLVGSGTASFGEIFSGILQDTGRAYIMGQTTDGNVEILWIYTFRDGSRLWLAHDTFRPLNHPDANWELSGIIPDQVAKSSWDEVTLETDPVVAAALQHFDSH